MSKETRNMTKIFTIGSNGKSGKAFFELIKKNHIDLVIDIRLNNKSQLSGFAKGGDDYLGYLLKEICNVSYIHDSYFAPTEDILDGYHKDKDWAKYELSFNKLIKERNIKEYFAGKYSKWKNICFLCVESTSDNCHRRLVAEFLVEKGNVINL